MRRKIKYWTAGFEVSTIHPVQWKNQGSLGKKWYVIICLNCVLLCIHCSIALALCRNFTCNLTCFVCLVLWINKSLCVNCDCLFAHTFSFNYSPHPSPLVGRRSCHNVVGCFQHLLANQTANIPPWDTLGCSGALINARILGCCSPHRMGWNPPSAGVHALEESLGRHRPTCREESSMGEALLPSPHRWVPLVHSYHRYTVCCCHFRKENVATELSSCVSLVLSMALKWWAPKELWMLPLQPLPCSSMALPVVRSPVHVSSSQ